MPNPLSSVLSFLRGEDLRAPGALARLEQMELPTPVQEIKLFFQPGTYQGGLSPYLQASLGNDALAGMTANSAVFACLHTLCTDYPEANLRVYRGDAESDQADVLIDHDLEELWKKPNLSLTGKSVGYWLQWAKQVDGNAYLRKVRGLGLVPVELWPVSPAQMWPVTTKEDSARGVFISYYAYAPDPTNRQIIERVPVEDIVHFRLGLDPNDRRLGCSPLKHLFREVFGDDEAAKWTESLLKNYAVPGLIVTIPREESRLFTEEMALALKAKIEAAFSNDNRGHVNVLKGGATMEQFGFSPEQLSLTSIRRHFEERVSAALRVPLAVAGLGGTSQLTHCLPGDSRVWTPNGPVQMDAVRPGMVVWSYVEGRLEPRRVVAQQSMGVKQVYRLRTKNRTILATDNHPFLVRVPGKSGRPYEGHPSRHPSLAWKLLGELRPGDKVVQPKALPDQGGEALPDGRPATVEMLQFLGALVGDGTVQVSSKTGGRVYMAMPETDRCVKPYREMAAALFSGKRGDQPVFVRSAAGGAHFLFQSTRDAKMLDGWGFGGRAHTKRVPSWVWSLSRLLRLAFLAGLVDTDGYIGKHGELQFDFCNRDLAVDVRDLLVSVGIQSSNVCYRRVKGSRLAHLQMGQQYDAWRFSSFSPLVAEIPFTDLLYRERVNSQTRSGHDNGLDSRKTELSSDFGFYTIVSIELLEEQTVYDIEVEGGHSFVADGVVVHNSNLRELREQYTETALIPQYTFDAATINLQLLPDFTRERRVFARYDITKMRALQEDTQRMWSRLDNSVKTGWLRKSEARRAAGYPPDEAEFDVPVLMPTPESLPGDAVSSPVANGPMPDARRNGSANRIFNPSLNMALTDLEQRALQHAPTVTPENLPDVLDALVQQVIPSLERDVQGYLTEQKVRVLAGLEAHPYVPNGNGVAS